MYAWYACAVCSYGTNSERNADNHEMETGHDIVIEDDGWEEADHG